MNELPEPATQPARKTLLEALNIEHLCNVDFWDFQLKQTYIYILYRYTMIHIHTYYIIYSYIFASNNVTNSGGSRLIIFSNHPKTGTLSRSRCRHLPVEALPFGSPKIAMCPMRPTIFGSSIEILDSPKKTIFVFQLLSPQYGINIHVSYP